MSKVPEMRKTFDHIASFLIIPLAAIPASGLFLVARCIHEYVRASHNPIITIEVKIAPSHRFCQMQNTQ